jgi:cell division protein ZipA
MSEWELRGVLLIIGACVLGAIYFLGKRPRRYAKRERPDDEKCIEGVELSLDTQQDPQEIPSEALRDELYPLEEFMNEEAQHRSQRTSPHHERRGQPKPRTRRVAAPRANNEKLVILHVAAKRPHLIAGSTLLSALNMLELEYNESRIFHHYSERLGEKQIVFSLANMVKPGTFDLDHIDAFSTPGVSLFMRLPGPLEGLKAFNTLLGCAQSLASYMSAEIQDDAHNPLTKQAVAQMREEIQLFSLRHSHLAKR